MRMRRRCLPVGWYPADPPQAEAQIAEFEERAASAALSARPQELNQNPAVAALAPHASWFFSGYLAYLAVSSLDRGAGTVIVFGGHQGPLSRSLVAMEDAFETPFGVVSSDVELRDAVLAEFPCENDCYADNTVEIQLPLIRRRFPEAKVLWIRPPASELAYSLGRRVATLAEGMGRRAVALGSADLTHYGPNYDFTPVGVGPKASSWAKDTNDRRFIDATLSGSWREALSHALAESSSCSPGAAVACCGFAQERKAPHARLLGYGQSSDQGPSSSFVGYAAIAWTPRPDA